LGQRTRGGVTKTTGEMKLKTRGMLPFFKEKLGGGGTKVRHPGCIEQSTEPLSGVETGCSTETTRCWVGVRETLGGKRKKKTNLLEQHTKNSRGSSSTGTKQRHKAKKGMRFLGKVFIPP